MKNSFLTLTISVSLLVFSTTGCDGMKQVTDTNTENYDTTDIEYYSDWSYTDKVYDPDIRSLQLYPTGNPMGPAIIDLSDPLPLVLHFDDLRGGYENYYVRLIHCTYEWEPSDLSPAEYIQGFDEIMINEIEQSFNTVQPYTHYFSSWPNDMSRPILSGNYLMKIYAEGMEDEPVCTRRIMVTEQLVRFRPNVKESTIVSERRYRQEVDFDVVQAGYQLIDPYRDFEVAILQNFRWDNAILNLKPVFMKGTELVYDFDEENNFDGLNEFRWIDTKSLRFAALGTDSLRIINDEWHIFLTPDQRRTYDVYRTDPDINGRYLIRNDEFDDHLEGQYQYVHFALAFDQPVYQSEFYIIGDFTQWQNLPENRMQWNAETKQYEATLYLKQGYYNYMYNMISPQHPDGDQTFIEGNHQQTENIYSIVAYNYDLRGYDRIVGILNTNTFNE